MDKEKVGQLESRAKLIVDQKQPFERVVVSKEECLRIFEAKPLEPLAQLKSSNRSHMLDSSGEPLQEGPHLVQAAGRLVDDRLPLRPLHRPLQGAAPPQHGLRQGLQADQKLDRPLARPGGQRRAAARVRHFLPRQEGAEGMGATSGELPAPARSLPRLATPGGHALPLRPTPPKRSPAAVARAQEEAAKRDHRRLGLQQEPFCCRPCPGRVRDTSMTRPAISRRSSSSSTRSRPARASSCRTARASTTS